MRILKTLAMLLALCLPGLGATTWPASTNANQTFFGANTFIQSINGSATNAYIATNALNWSGSNALNAYITGVSNNVVNATNVATLNGTNVYSGTNTFTQPIVANITGSAAKLGAWIDASDGNGDEYSLQVLGSGTNSSFTFNDSLQFFTIGANLLPVYANSFHGNGASLTALAGANITAGTINSNKLDAATAAQLALAGSGGGDVFKAGNNSFSGSNYFTGTEYMAGAVRMADGSLIATNMTARTNDPAVNALTTYGNAEVKGTLTSAAFSGLGVSLTGISSNSFDAQTKAQLALAGGGGITALTGDGTASGSGSVALSVSNITPGFTISTGQFLQKTASGWVGANPSGSGDVVSTNVNTFTKSNYFASDLTVGGNLYINGTNATTSLSNLVVGGTLIVTGAVTGASFSGSGAGLTGIPGSAVSGASSITNGLISSGTAAATYLPLVGGTVSGPVLSTSSTTNAPSATELSTAGWVRSLFNNGILDYATTNIVAGATNNDTAGQPVYSFLTSIPPSASRSYANPGVGTYVGAVMTTNTFTFLQGPIEVNAYMTITTGGGDAMAVHPEIYYSYDKTNWYGDYEAQQQSIVGGTTNLYQFVISFPAITATNSSGFYIERRFKVHSKGGSPTLTFLVGTNIASGVANASHISFSGPNSAAGNAYLPNDQTFTGNNTFGNFTASVVTNNALTASRVVLSDANKKEVSATASGAVPIDADGTATSGAQLVTVLGTTAVGRATGDASGNTITTTYAPLASPTFTGTATLQGVAMNTNTWAVNTAFGIGSNCVYVTASTVTIGVTGTVNASATTASYGELAVQANGGTITFTNIASMHTSDYLTSRTITNANWLKLSCEVMPGQYTNLYIVQMK